jgi:hypothetical protein
MECCRGRGIGAAFRLAVDSGLGLDSDTVRKPIATLKADL